MNVVTVPSWATAMITNYRRLAALPETMTDARIFGVLKDCRHDGTEVDEKIERLREARDHG